MSNKIDEQTPESENHVHQHNHTEKISNTGNKLLDKHIYEIILLTMIVIFASFWIITYSDYKQLPGPLYGGDVYLYYAHLNHVYSGGSVFESHQYFGEYTHYPWLLAVIMSIFCFVSGMSVFHTYIYSGIMLLIFAGIASYWTGYKIFNNKIIALMISATWMLAFNPWSSNTIFNFWVLLPLIPLVYFYKRNILAQAAMGLLYGACALIDIIPFLTINGFLILLLLYRILDDNIKISEGKIIIKKRFSSSFKEFFKDYWLMALIGLPIAMLYWFAPIFVYHGQTPNPLHEYVASGLNLGFSGFVKSIQEIIKIILPINNFISVIMSFLTLFGIVMVFRQLRTKKEYWVIILFILIGIIGYTHPIITKPLLGFEVGHYGFPRIFFVSNLLLIFVGITYLMEHYKRIKYLPIIIIILFTVLIGVKFFYSYSDYSSSQWTKLGFTDDNNIMLQYEFAKFIQSKTNVDDVFLVSHEEVGFALNSLTGRKVMFLRRTHANPFVDINKRIADAAVIMYGNNDTLRKELIEHYRIKYFYADPYGLKNYESCLQAWDVLGEPGYADYTYACLRTDPKYEQYLNNNGIETKKVNVRLDVASNEAPRFDMIIIKPVTLKIKLSKIQDIVYQNITYYGFYNLEVFV